MQYSIAIKLGSSNTSILKQGEGIVLLEPSLVAFTGVGKDKVVKAVGNKAKRMLGRTDGRTQVVSPIKAGKIVDAKLAEVMLNHFLEKVLGRGIVKPKIRAIVCVPLSYSVQDRKLLEEVCYNCGINDVSIVPAIMCGALGYGLPVEEPKGMCLVNIGGGSTDVAVISMNSIIAGVNIGVGGITIDKGIEETLLEKYKLQIGSGVADKLKEDVASLYKNDSSTAEVGGIDIETKMAKDEIITSKDLYDKIDILYSAIIDAIKTVLNNCPPNVVEDVCNSGICLMGGASLVTGVEQYFKKALGISIRIEDYTSAIDVLGAGKLLKDNYLLKAFTEV